MEMDYCSLMLDYTRTLFCDARRCLVTATTILGQVKNGKLLRVRRVTEVFAHPIAPCSRLRVDKMNDTTLHRASTGEENCAEKKLDDDEQNEYNAQRESRRRRSKRKGTFVAVPFRYDGTRLPSVVYLNV